MIQTKCDCGKGEWCPEYGAAFNRCPTTSDAQAVADAEDMIREDERPGWRGHPAR